MNEVSRKFGDVISDKQLADLYRRCNYNKYYDDNDFYFRSNDFINGYSIIEYGYEEDSSWGERYTNIINSCGDFVEIKLNNNIKYTNGEIVKLNNLDEGSYSFEIHRILELDYKYELFTGYFVKSRSETSFFYIKVSRFSNKRDEGDKDSYFVINSDLKVIATFYDDNTWGNKYDGYSDCNVYTERKFFFINKDRKYLVFSQKLIANSDEAGFFEEHMYGLAPDLYDDQMREFGVFDDSSEDNYNIYEYELDEEILSKVIEKFNGIRNESSEEDNIPDIEDITFFYDDKNNNLYKNVFNDYYIELFGIIDCRIPAKNQLLPFTDNINYVIRIIWDRWKCDKEIEENGLYYGSGWDFNNRHFHGNVMCEKFFDYPPVFKGFTLNYVLTYYPDTLKYMIDRKFIIIPNKLLDRLNDNELTRYIRIEQEIHLDYSPISSIEDTLISNEKYGIVSTYQGQTLRQIIYSKGGTKYLVNLLKYTNFKISKGVLTELINASNNQLETNCYNIILNVIDDIEYQGELRNDYIREKMEEDVIRDANQEFNDMMNDLEAWGNID